MDEEMMTFRRPFCWRWTTTERASERLGLGSGHPRPQGAPYSERKRERGEAKADHVLS
jgi:hypothetical protein